MDTLSEFLQKNNKALFYAVGFASIWAILVRVWKKRLENNLGFVVDSSLKDEYDYIIVGGGTAGCIIASRLSEDKKKTVLLLEVGSTALGEVGIKSPILWTSLFFTPHEWPYETSKQEHLSKRKLIFHRARLLGGNSNNDNMLFYRGCKSNYNNWVKHYGLCNWNYSDLLPFFKLSESYNEISVDKYQRGLEGPIKIEELSNPTIMGEHFIDACQKIGLPFIDIDYNLSKHHGVSYAHLASKNGLRQDSAESYLKPIFQKRSNLTIKTGSFVTKVIIEDNIAKGVQYSSPYDDGIINAKKEVIISCGPINSPTLLMLSGIGPKEHLEDNEIEVKKDLPNVGKNLKDQLLVPLSFSTNSKWSIDHHFKSIISFFKALLNYQFYSKGVLYSPFIDAIATEYANNENTPALQYYATTKNFSECFNFDETVRPKPGVSFVSVLLNPKSKGSITLKNSDPFEAPKINPNYLAEGDDKKTLIHGMQQCYKISQTSFYSEISNDLIIPKELHDHEEKDDHFWEEYMKTQAQSTNFQVGTCSMGSDETNSVVDKYLKVHGIQNLRVIDSSVIPEHIGNCNGRAITMEIAERGASFLKE